MKKEHLLFLLVFLIFSCTNKEEKLRQQILPVIREAVLNDSIVFSIDSLQITKIDTLTDLKDSLFKNQTLGFLIKMEYSSIEFFNQIAELEGSSAKLSHSQASLYKSVLSSDVLAKSEIETAKRHIDEMGNNIDSAKLHKEKADYYNVRMKNILNLRQNKKIDSTTFRGYIAHFKLLGADKQNKLIKRDSDFVVLSPNLRIIPIGNLNR